jgi:hypothetical protein
MVCALLAAVAAAAAWAGAAISPASGTNGTILSLAAFGFDPGTKKPKVALVPAAGGKNVAMKVISASATQIEAQVVKGLAGNYGILITPADRAVAPITLGGTFTIVVPAPTAVSPATGPVKLPVVITGDSFGVAKGKVKIGGKNAKVTRWASDRIECVVPKKLAAGAHPVVVTGKSGTSTASLTYTVTGGAGGGGEFMRVDVGATHLEQTQRSQFYLGGSYNVSQDFAGVGVSKPPGANPSFGLTINHPQFATPMPYDVTTGPTATGTLGSTYSDGAGSVYQAMPGSDMKLTITAYAGGILEGTFGGTLTKVAGPGPDTVVATNGAFRLELTITGQ